MSEYSTQGPEFYPDDDNQTWMSDCRSSAKRTEQQCWLVRLGDYWLGIGQFTR